MANCSEQRSSSRNFAQTQKRACATAGQEEGVVGGEVGEEREGRMGRGGGEEGRAGGGRQEARGGGRGYSLGQGLLARHVVAVLLLRVKVPPPHRALLVALVHLQVVHLVLAVVDGVRGLHHPADAKSASRNTAMSHQRRAIHIYLHGRFYGIVAYFTSVVYQLELHA